MYKAILDENNICIGLCSNSPLIAEGILVDRDVTGMKYDNGKWVVCIPEPEESEPDAWEEMAQAISEGVNDSE